MPIFQTYIYSFLVFIDLNIKRITDRSAIVSCMHGMLSGSEI